MIRRPPPSPLDLLAFVGCFVLPVLGGAAVVGIAVLAILAALYR